jgi:hypothetical protein
MEASEKVEPTCHVELSTAGLEGVDAERQAMSIEFASRDTEWHKTATRKLLLKIDLHLLPWVVLMYLTNFLDRKYGFITFFISINFRVFDYTC